jgi:hypothetical protein
LAALRGDEMLLKKVLDSGKVHVDCKDEVIKQLNTNNSIPFSTNEL